MPDCLFCAKPLTHATPPEHVLLDCLGGRLKSKRLVCGPCNRLLGGSIDAALARAVQSFRAAHGLPSGSRNRAPGGEADAATPDLTSPDCRRSLAKMLLLLWIEAFGDGGLEAAKAYVLRGEGDIFVGAAEAPPPRPGFGPFSHNLEVIGLEGAASLYGGPTWRFRLGDHKPGRVWLTSDPAQPAEWLAGKGL